MENFGYLLAAVIGSALTLLGQFVTARSSLRAVEARVAYERWDRWRASGAATWAEAATLAHEIDQPYEVLASLAPSELDALRAATRAVAKALNQLSVDALDRRTSEWAGEIAALLMSLGTGLPTHLGCHDAARAEQFDALRCHLHVPLEWADGAYCTELDRLRVALTRATTLWFARPTKRLLTARQT
jgi:hypothetical protein